MEFSSPLAAMHHPSHAIWGGQKDLPGSRLMYTSSSSSSSQTLGSNNFNFRDLSMVRSNSDYFTCLPPRTYSPTTSLAADLSTNFHIDRSPQIPTPRRSLFSRHLSLDGGSRDLLVTPPILHEEVRSPPISSSSPNFETLEASPLPHKPPCFVARITLASPSPEPTRTQDGDYLTSQDMAIDAARPTISTMALQMVLPERKKGTVGRPALTRPKTYSSAGPGLTIQTVQEKPLLPPFQFGNGSVTMVPLHPTDEIIDSPMDDQFPDHSFKAPTSVPMRPSLSSGGRLVGSPVVGLVRKATGAAPPRPRKQVRRSISMFQHPEDVIKDHEDYQRPCAALMPSPKLEMEYKNKLPHSLSSDPDSLPRIQQDTLIKVLSGDYASHYDKIMIIDCRFEYEYEGGHIDGAINFNDKDLLVKDLFETNSLARTLLILHCEYSVHRAPRMARFVRNRDRAVNDFRYPQLTFPEMYILDGGYSQFFKLFRTRCVPQNYVEMEHKDHEMACEKGMGKLKQRAKLNRAKTFAFGQHSPCRVEDSPTSGLGLSRRSPSSRSFSSMQVNDMSPMLARHFTRRLATA